ncbi:MAG: capsule biosynthesis GfcC family protein [Pseudomonas sp.]|uniref:capsule biosynthesis GfcC family protein n=1 Tax=Pseudomonas abieticivorans TaxID=2931382 RepID=UPI0020C0695F|nr:capsule biosynthesis GfcC family protein [Pseudomonas sp. PIA16]MDE1167888.1 capsule biosynthesis GfcC family protein [Pseudomonas sp.]
MRRLAGVLAGLAMGAAQAGQVTVSGDVLYPGTVALPAHARLLDAVTAVQPNAQSYWLAAGWLRASLVQEQVRLKTGVLFDLKLLERGAMLEGLTQRAAIARRVYQWVAQLPVTGRQVAVLDPVALEVGFARNDRVEEGDRLVYPRRSGVVQVMGAVARPCRLPYQPLLQARDYLRDCPALVDADPDDLWLIQPDGHVRRIGAAAWNRESAAVLADGGTLWVPIRTDDLDVPVPELNQQLTEFLATQLAEVAP